MRQEYNIALPLTKDRAFARITTNNYTKIQGENDSERVDAGTKYKVRRQKGIPNPNKMPNGATHEGHGYPFLEEEKTR
jgi:hypothetical protein